ncbi:MAG: ABC transporter permease, partial [Gemmatimonadaceae bacterium]
MRELLARLRDWLRRDQLDAELREELQFHRDRLAHDEVTYSSDASNALHSANRRLGNTTSIREASRERWSIPTLDNLQQDVRFALRGLRRNPGFTITVVLTLALGFGANAAVFSLLDRLFARLPSGVENAETLQRIYLTQFDEGKQSGIRDLYNNPQWRDLHSALNGVPSTAYAVDTTRLGDANSATLITATYTDSAYWPVLGARIALGRAFTSAEARIEAAGNVVIISDVFWQDRFSRAANVLGQTLNIANRRYVVIGVASKEFNGVDIGATDIWLPLGAMPMQEGDPGRFWFDIRGTPLLHAIVRVPLTSNRDAQIAQVNSRLTTVFRGGSVAGGYPRDSIAIVSTGSIIAARGPMNAGQEVLISTRLAWVSMLVLLIACANVANMLLTRLIERRKEIAVRLALGVSRARLARQFVIESLLLATLALSAAIVAANWAGVFLRAALMPRTRWAGAAIEARFAALLVAGALLSAIAIALVPMLHVRSFSTADILRDGQRSAARGSNRFRSALISAQVALAVVLLTGAALCVESFRRVLKVDLGYDVPNVAFAIPTMLGSRGGETSSQNAARGQALLETAENLARIPGIESVARSSTSPIGGLWMIGMRIDGDSAPRLNGHSPGIRAVSPDYWRTVGMRAVRGRVSSESDVTGAPLVVFVNETMARTMWHGRDPIGQCVALYNGPCRTVAGVVRDVHFSRVVAEPAMQMYMPLAQAGRKGEPAIGSVLIIRSAPSHLQSAVAEMKRALSAALPTAQITVQTLQQEIEPQYRPWKLGAMLFTTLGALGLLVSSIGLYGVIAYGVRRRLHELGIRAALGAERKRLVLLVLGQGMRTVVSGLLLGIALSFALSRFISAIVYETSLRDPIILGGVSLTMLVTALIASFLPAWQAGSV